MSQAIEQGYVTYDALNAAVPSDDYTSEEIEDVVALLSSKGIAIVDTQPEETTPKKGVATYEYRPGMKFYEAVWKRDGEEIFRLHTHAADEAEAIARGHACFADRPELCMGHNLERATVGSGMVRLHPSLMILGKAGVRGHMLARKRSKAPRGRVRRLISEAAASTLETP